MASKQFWSWILIGSQLLWGSAAFAAPTGNQNPAVTPEQALLVSLIKLRGANLSSEQMRAAMDDKISQYARSVPQDGEQRSLLRLEQAFVSLNVYAPEQAHDFITDAEEGARELRVSGFSSAEAQTRATAAELSHLTALYPAGAQFSACTADRIALFGGFALFAAPVMANNGQLYSNEQPAYDISMAGGILTLVAFVAYLTGACS